MCSCRKATGVHSVCPLASCLHHWSDIHAEDTLPHLWHPCWRRTGYESPSHESQLTANTFHYSTTVRAQLSNALFICAVTGHHGAVVHWSRWRSLVILIMATVLTSACADLATEHIQPILNQPNISQVRTCARACSVSFYGVVSSSCANVCLSFSSISLGWQFSLWFLRSQRLLMGYSLLSKTTSVLGKSCLIKERYNLIIIFVSKWFVFCQLGGGKLYCCSGLHATNSNSGLL